VRLKDENESVYELTEQEAAWMGFPHARLFIKALKAVHKKELQARFDGELLRGHPHQSLESLVSQTISALERNPHFYVSWFRMITVDPDHYRRWRDKNTNRVTDETPRRPLRASPQKVKIAVSNYVAEKAKSGQPVSQKGIWKWARTAIPAATYNQVVKAMAEAEGGKKARGRPRKSSAN